MFNKPAVSARELEEESAELLPSRETLQVVTIQHHPGGPGVGGHHHGHHGHHGHHHGHRGHHGPRW